MLCYIIYSMDYKIDSLYNDVYYFYFIEIVSFSSKI